MKKIFTILVSLLIIGISSFYIYSNSFINKKQEVNTMPLVQDKKTIVNSEENINTNNIVEKDELSPYEQELYKKYSQQSENCLFENPSNIEIKLCASDISSAVDKEIKERKEYIINKINIKINELTNENDDLVLRYIKNVPSNIEDTYKSWLNYRSSFCLAMTEIAMDGNGYSGFLSSCEYTEGFKFMKFLNSMELHWTQNI